MARMYSKGHGKSKSSKPFSTAPPSHITLDEVTNIVIDLSKKGKTGAEIGKILRDEHGVGKISSIADCTMLELLKKNNIAPEIPDDVKAIEKKCLAIYNHIKKEWNDKDARYRLKHKESRLHRLVRYYKTKGVLPAAFKPASFKLNKKMKSN
ncbi:40S ribosomal protein S13 [Cucumispora dikerogammari]|nr:40S ribosomal protein S13 [Cucumispora dikerogammari]